MSYIVTSRMKGARNWSGKEFSEHPAKLYATADDVVQALLQYWYHDSDKWDPRQITIVPLNEHEERELLAFGKIRW